MGLSKTVICRAEPTAAGILDRHTMCSTLNTSGSLPVGDNSRRESHPGPVFGAQHSTPSVEIDPSGDRSV